MVVTLIILAILAAFVGGYALAVKNGPSIHKELGIISHNGHTYFDSAIHKVETFGI